MDNDERDSSSLHIIGRTIGVAIVIGAVVASIYAFRVNFVKPRTDDAAVRANVVGIAPHVSGPIVDLRVADNQFVKQGDLLFAIDCRPYEAQLARARADLALTLKEVEAQRKTIASATSEIARREASLAASTAEITRAEEERAAAEAALAKLQAEAAYAEDYLHRVEPLLKREFVTADKVADARTRRDASAAAVQEARRRVRAAEAAVKQGVATRQGAARAVEQSRHDVSRAQDQLAQFGDLNARIQAAEASVRAAELDVGYCRVSAPFDAYVTNLNIAVGEYARQGQQVFALVDNRAWYVLANFRETYMSSIKPGMEADVYLLSYPGRRFRGVVQGIGWANKPQDGATVGVLPEVQQTLNWVRLANRFQVRVRLQEPDPEHPFRMGTTAVVTIRGFPPGTSSAALARP
jgi:membrane fusion protein, multidrug efflux system